MKIFEGGKPFADRFHLQSFLPSIGREHMQYCCVSGQMFVMWRRAAHFNMATVVEVYVRRVLSAKPLNKPHYQEFLSSC